MKLMFSRKMLAALLTTVTACALTYAAPQTVTLANRSDATFNRSPEMTFNGGATNEGVVLEFQGIANSPNWMRVNIPVTMTVPEDGRLEVSYTSEVPMTRYFAAELMTTDGATYSALIGIPKRGYRFNARKSDAVVLLEEFKSKDGKTLPAGATVGQVNLVLTTVPEASPSKITFHEVRFADVGS